MTDPLEHVGFKLQASKKARIEEIAALNHRKPSDHLRYLCEKDIAENEHKNPEKGKK